MTEETAQVRERPPLAFEGRYASVFGWVTVVSIGALLCSGAIDSLYRGLPSRWGQVGAFSIFALSQLGTVDRKRSPIARALASILFLGCTLEIYWHAWGPNDGTYFAWSNLGIETLRDGLLLWGLGLGALVLTLAPTAPSMRLLGGLLGLFLMLPWIWGLSRGSSRLTIIEGPEWLDFGWYIQPAFIALCLLLPVALIALIETAYKLHVLGALEHGVLIGLGFLSMAPLGLLILHQIDPDLMQAAPQLTEADAPAKLVDKPHAHAHGRDDHHHHSAVHEQTPVATPAPNQEPKATTETTQQDSLKVHSLTPLLKGEDDPSGDDLAICRNLITPERDVNDIRDVFKGTHWHPASVVLLRRRFPAGAALVEELDDPDLFERGFPMAPVSWRRTSLGMSSAIYETVRLIGFRRLTEESYRYPINTTESFEVPRLTLFPSSEIRGLLPTAINELKITERLLGEEASGKHIEDLLDHLNAYTWSMMTELALLDQTAGRDIAARDTVLLALAYTDTYLRHARTTRPKDYAKIRDTEAMRSAVVGLWDRAVCSLRLSGTESRLGIEDVALLPVLFGSGRAPEVDAIRRSKPTLPPQPPVATPQPPVLTEQPIGSGQN